MLLMVALAVAGSVLHTRHPGWAPLGAALRVASAVLVGLAPGDGDAAPCRARGRGRRDPAVSGWLTLAVAHGPSAGPLRGVLVIGGTLAAVPW